jgi:selenocysteine lyase/cysteine desulfurase
VLNLDLIRSEFPVTSKYAYFDHAAVGPLPTRVLDATKRVVQEKSEGGIHWESWEEQAEAARKSIAELVGAREEEIALTTSTSEGLAIVANGLSYEKDQNIVTCDMEFASNLFPWQALTKRHGLELRVVRNHEASLKMEDFSDVIDAKTKVVSISYVQYSNGFRTDLAELSKIAHENGAYVVTDAVQAVGQMPINVTDLGVDFLASSGYKWLLSPISTGFLYVRRGLLDELWPTIVGYRSDENPMDFNYRNFQPAQTARRYEAGQLNFPGFAGMREAIGLLENIGIENVWSRILSLIGLLRNGLKRNNTFQIQSSMDEKSRSGILNFACQNPDSIAKRLFEHRIVISVRGGGLRISPHFYNTEEEIHKLLSELNAL